MSCQWDKSWSPNDALPGPCDWVACLKPPLPPASTHLRFSFVFFCSCKHISGSRTGTVLPFHLERMSSLFVTEDIPLRRIQPSWSRPTHARMAPILSLCEASLIFLKKRMTGQDVSKVHSCYTQCRSKYSPQVLCAPRHQTSLWRESGTLSLRFSLKSWRRPAPLRMK